VSAAIGFAGFPQPSNPFGPAFADRVEEETAENPSNKSSLSVPEWVVVYERTSINTSDVGIPK
jgi:hypothetical protein